MESIEINLEKYAVVLNINLNKATLIEAKEFKDYFEEAVTKTDKDIIVNLSVCEYLDSTFLGILVKTHKKLLAQNRTIAIIEPVNQSSILLTLNSIGKIFPIYSSVKIALDDIENKRLLESEFQEATSEFEDSENNPELISSEVDIQSLSEETTNQSEDLELENFESDTMLKNKNLEIPEQPADPQHGKEELSWNILENQESEFNSNPVQTLETKESEESFAEAEEVKDIIEYEISHSGQRSIKWEFGFSS